MTEEVKKEKPGKDEQNGTARPKAGTKTGRVWEIADELSAKANAPVARAEVLVQAAEEEINSATASTQYGRWRKYHGLEKEVAPKVEAKPKKAKASKTTEEVTVEAEA